MLEKLCLPMVPPELGAEWHKFDSRHPNVFKNRLTLCANIAAALFQIHEAKQYTLVDLKPQNILVRSDGYIFIIDVDSFQVHDRDRVLFHVQVATPDYTPPEAYRLVIRPTDHHIHESWDRFSLAIILYRILCGIHPFTCTPQGHYENCATTEEKITHGLFPYASSKTQFIDVIPPPHKTFNTLDSAVRQLFLRCFEDGHTNPALRPSAEEWCEVIAPQQMPLRPVPSKRIAFPHTWGTIPLKLPEKPVRQRPPKLSDPAAGPPQRFQRQQSSAVRRGRYVVLTALAVSAASHYLDILSPGDGIPLAIAFATAVSLVALYRKSKESIDKNKAFALWKAMENDVKYANQIISEKESFMSELEMGWQKIQEHFEQEQKRIIFDEQKKMEEQRKVFASMLAEKDTEAEILRKREAEAVQQAQAELQKLLDGLHVEYAKNVSRLHPPSLDAASAVITPLRQRLFALQSHQNREAQLLAHQHTGTLHNLQQVQQQLSKKLSALDNDRGRELQKLNDEFPREELSRKKAVMNRELAKQRIQEHRFRIFTDANSNPPELVANLARSGFETAADITGAQDSGMLCRADGRWIKIPKIGKHRASCLLTWRHSLERTVEQQLVPAALKQLRQEYESKKQNLSFSFDKDRKSLQSQLDNAMASTDKQGKTFQAVLQALHFRFDLQKRDLEKDIQLKEKQYKDEVRNFNIQLQNLEKVFQEKSEHARASAQEYVAQTQKRFQDEYHNIMKAAEDRKQQYQGKIHSIGVDTQSRLRRNYESSLTHLHDIKSHMDNCNREHTDAIKAYNTMIDHTGSLLGSFPAYGHITFPNFILAIIGWKR
jgi:serine/threonine protein kinase